MPSEWHNLACILTGSLWLLCQGWTDGQGQKQGPLIRKLNTITQMAGYYAQGHIHSGGRVSCLHLPCLTFHSVMPHPGADGLTKRSLFMDVLDFFAMCGRGRKLLWDLCYFEIFLSLFCGKNSEKEYQHIILKHVLNYIHFTLQWDWIWLVFFPQTLPIIVYNL